jgi:hypothetical protein
MLESVEDCFYYFQSSNGENMFLHPLCAQILEKAFPPSPNGRENEDADAIKVCNLPLELKDLAILEIEQGIAADLKLSESKEFKKLKVLHHLPPGVQFGLVEVDLSAIVPREILDQFREVLQKRSKQRSIKDQKEQKYMRQAD